MLAVVAIAVAVNKTITSSPSENLLRVDKSVEFDSRSEADWHLKLARVSLFVRKADLPTSLSHTGIYLPQCTCLENGHTPDINELRATFLTDFVTTAKGH